MPMAPRMNLLGNAFDYGNFFRHHWQKQPLLIRASQAFPDPLDPETLAGLACETAVESRLVTRQGRNSWTLRHGPFRSRDFRLLGNRNWTLLVQAVDQWLPAVQGLRQQFDFLPAWRIDDVMVSYATPGGSVGPHFDYYDVFLIQGLGSRKWKTGSRCDHTTRLRLDSDLKLLKSFKAQSEYTLHPGDILYLPPGISHFGVALEDSLCYSIGFRAPSFGEMIHGYTDQIADQTHADQRFEDTLSGAVRRSGELSISSLLPTYEKLLDRIQDPDKFADWFACNATLPKYPELIEPPPSTYNAARIRAAKKRGRTLVKNSFSRFCYIRSGGNIRLYADGRSRVCPGEHLKAIQLLCEPDRVRFELSAANWLQGPMIATVTELLNQGSLLLE